MSGDMDTLRAALARDMTLRDYFAAVALLGAVASPARFTKGFDEEGFITQPEEYAALAYIFADEMLKARGGAA